MKAHSIFRFNKIKVKLRFSLVFAGGGKFLTGCRIVAQVGITLCIPKGINADPRCEANRRTKNNQFWKLERHACVIS